MNEMFSQTLAHTKRNLLFVALVSILHTFKFIKLEKLFFLNGAINNENSMAPYIISAILLTLLAYLLWSVKIRVDKEKIEEEHSVFLKFEEHLEKQRSRILDSFLTQLSTYEPDLIKVSEYSHVENRALINKKELEILYNKNFTYTDHTPSDDIIKVGNFLGKVIEPMLIFKDPHLKIIDILDRINKGKLSENELDEKEEIIFAVYNTFLETFESVNNLSSKRDKHKLAIQKLDTLEKEFPKKLGWVALICIVGKYEAIYLHYLAQSLNS